MRERFHAETPAEGRLFDREIGKKRERRRGGVWELELRNLIVRGR